MTALLICLGGGLGAVARFLIDGSLRARWPGLGHWATAIINITGSLLLGMLFGWLTAGDLTPRWESATG